MSFTYRGTSSDTMKFNVTERQVYNAPAFDVNAIEVPGRDGDLLNSQNRFQNKTITYTGFLREQDFPGDTKRERLSRGLRELKAWICGDAGHYHDLTDDYDPGFIRRAYISGETAINEILDQPDGVTLTITFRAEPFMYLEGNPFNVPETGTKSGDIATFTGVDAPLQSLKFYIEPSQSGSGDPSPTNIRPISGWSQVDGVADGKNLLDCSITATAGAGTTIIKGTGTFTVTNNSGTRYFGANFWRTGIFLADVFKKKKYKLSFDISGTLTARWTIGLRTASGSVCVTDNFVTADDAGHYTCDIDLESMTEDVYLSFSRTGNSTSNSEVTFSNVQLEVGTTATAYETPNIRPITVALGQTVYGGYVDALEGKLVITKGSILAKALTFTRQVSTPSDYGTYFATQTVTQTFKGWGSGGSDTAICNALVKSATGGPTTSANGTFWWNNAGTAYRVIWGLPQNGSTIDEFYTFLNDNNVMFVGELATPIEVDLTPVSVSSLLGQNNVWCNTGSTEVVYIDPTENPTGFASKPLWEITMSGAGILTVNGKTWSIGAYTGTLYCDTDIMDWYNSSSLQNDLVSGSDFPELQPGENIIFYTGGITNVKVTPRWRAL